MIHLEKEMDNAPAIDTIFRMAHSIKSMAASLGYDPVADLSHRIEDRMEGVRASGRVSDFEELELLFRSLEALETMVAAISGEQGPVPADAALIDALAAQATALADPLPSALPSDSPDAVGGEPKKV